MLIACHVAGARPRSGFDFGSSVTFGFESHREASCPYRQPHKTHLGGSVARSHAWSVFSSLSLGDDAARDVSILSVIALPIHADEIDYSCI